MQTCQLAHCSPAVGRACSAAPMPVIPMISTERCLLPRPTLLRASSRASLGISPVRAQDLAVSPGGEIYIVDTGNNRILRSAAARINSSH